MASSGTIADNLHATLRTRAEGLRAYSFVDNIGRGVLWDNTCAPAAPMPHLDIGSPSTQNSLMSPMIQIRNVPDEIHRRAKARAALSGLTLSEFALRALERELQRPTPGALSARIRALAPVRGAPSGAALVREERDRR